MDILKSGRPLRPPPRGPEARQDPSRLSGDIAVFNPRGIVQVVELGEVLVHPYQDHFFHVHHRPRRTPPEQPFRPGCQRSRQPDPLPEMKLLDH
jgi:hypothetical protein